MSLRAVPELRCMEPENYKKFFRALCWTTSRRHDKRISKKLGKKEKLRRQKAAAAIPMCYAPLLLGNPSEFAVFATIRKSILNRWRYLQGGISEFSDDSDNEDSSSLLPYPKLPKVTGIGLRTVFALVAKARFSDVQFCEQALRALLDVLQGHSPEDLYQEPIEVISSLHTMLVDVASGYVPGGHSETPSNLTALSSSCLIALTVARGEAELILNAAASLIMSTPVLAEQYVQVPTNLTVLQRSVQSVVLGKPSRNQWMNFGVPLQSLVTCFPVDLPMQLTSGSSELIVRSLASDGCYLYVYTSRGLLKIGSGYGSSIRQHVYMYKPDFFPTERHGWLGYCKNKLYVRIGRKKTEVYEVDKETLEVKGVLRMESGLPACVVEAKTAVFTDGNELGLIFLTTYESLIVRMYDPEQVKERIEGTPTILTSADKLSVQLLRRHTLIFGRSPFDDGFSRRRMEVDVPMAVQMEDDEDDPLMGICVGQDFCLLNTMSGRVYYTGKGSSLGYKTASPVNNRWTLIKETVFTRNEVPEVKNGRVTQVAVGHEGAHAILVMDNGVALFTGVARRGEDGDISKHRRTPKPTKPKKILKAEGHHIVYAACNYGSTALVTKQGLLLMFGKDTQHCDAGGVVVGLKHERISKVALGKAHAAALTHFGLVYTFGINNKGQCGREFGYTKEKSYSRRHGGKEDVRLCSSAHVWASDYCRICTICRECTGFSSSCSLAQLPNRMPGDKCGCGEGDSGCGMCGVCRRCVEGFAANIRAERSALVTDLDDDADASQSNNCDKENVRCHHYDTQPGPDDRESSLKVSTLPPARLAVPGGHRVQAIACGLHHTVLLTEHGEVLTFGSNQLGQLGAGDVSAHHRIVKARLPRCIAIATGSNHTAAITKDGELFTFGAYQKGALGRPRSEEISRNERSLIWHATPQRVACLGPRHASKATGVMATGDQTFIQVSQAVIKPEFLFSSTIMANANSIVILPNRPEHTFKCITVNKNDGNCTPWTGSEQVDFVNTLTCLDPHYDVLWCFSPQMRVMKCYNILTFDSNKQQKCKPDMYSLEAEYEYPNYGCMKRLEDFKNMETLDLKMNNEKPADSVALSNMSVLNQELAIPITPGHSVTRMHAALHLLGCLDSLNYAHELSQADGKRDHSSSMAPLKDEYLTVNRFDSHGGGWGYSGHSVEAIRFMSDTDIILGGYGLFGGRGDYTAKIKLFDIGTEGGDQEGDGELLAESEEVVFECAPRDRFPVLFETAIPLAANRWYVAWACINGPSSDCGSSGQPMVINEEVGFHFKTSKKSNNGTDVNAGQIPCLLYNLVGSEHAVTIRCVDYGEPVFNLSSNLSRKVSVQCFKSLITLLQWSWQTFKEILLDTNGQIPINYQKLTTMKHQKRLVYVIRASLRLVKSYIIEVYPQQNKRRNSHEYMSYFDTIAETRNFIQSIMAEATPTCAMLPRKPGKTKAQRICYVQFALEMTNAILKEAHDTITTCFHAFFPTPTLKWNHLCFLLFNVKDGIVPPSQVRELTAVCAAMCASKSLRDVLQYVVPVTQNHIIMNENRRPDSKVMKDVPSKSATVPRSSHQKPPPIPPRANHRDAQRATDKSSHMDWHLLDVIPKLLDIVMIPIKQQMMTRQCGQPHDHGEIQQNDKLAEFCCKLTARVIAELSYSATNVKEDSDANTVKHLVTPSRFMRVNQQRAWNTGNGSPDAICFTVDRAGVMLVGAAVYSGLGNYEYTLELLQDLRLRPTCEEADPGHCWVSVEVAHGTFSSIDCQHDMVQIKFERPVALKEDLRYAIRLCNQGGRTANGDCGLPSVKGPDGTTFKFSSCSLSFNGTTLARGQIPCLIYYGSTKLQNPLESPDTLISTLRAMTLRVASTVMERGADLFCGLRNELTAEDLRRNAAVLQHSPVINTLLPYTLASLEGLDDSKSVIKELEMIHKLLPHVAAMNLLLPVDEPSASTTHFYTWVESDHPYKPACVSNIRVLFPASVSWMVLEFDPRSVTAQPEDSVTVYAMAGVPKVKCHKRYDPFILEPPFRKRLIQLSSENDVEDVVDEGEAEVPCMHYNCTYVSVTSKLANVPTDWPQRALIVPGNEVIFSLETASDYLSEFNKRESEENHFGYKCLCIGYEESHFTSQRQGLVTLEMELVYAGAACASRLLSPDLDIPPLTFATIVEVQVLAMIGTSYIATEGETNQDGSESLLLSRGLEISSPPTIHQVLDGQPLLRCVTTERQFLSDFVAGAECTAGGRLARWLAPTPRVEPSKCEMKPPTSPPRPASRSTLQVIIRDQYGEAVSSPALKVEVVVQRLEELSARQSRLVEGRRGSLPDVSYQATIRDTMSFQAITIMKAYQSYSFEELRFLSGHWGATCLGGGLATSGRVPTERLPVRAQPDGSYTAMWTPRAPGIYLFRCTLDDQPAPQELTVDVAETSIEENEEQGTQEGPQQPSPPPKLLRFLSRHSAGLRVRASPSLQAEELGRVPPGANVAFVEEIVNKDGTWVRLSEQSAHAFTDSTAEIAWCLQHHRHLDRALLVPVEPGSPPLVETSGTWLGYGNAQGDMQTWMQEDEIEGTSGNEITCTEERRFPFSILTNVTNQTVRSTSPFVFGQEPSKRDRSLRNDSCSSPRRLQGRSNGNSEEWWSPAHQRDNPPDVDTIPETDIEAEAERRLDPVGDQEPDSLQELPEKTNERNTSTRVTQTGTQTSPEHLNDAALTSTHSCIVLPKEGRLSPKSLARERIANRSRAYRRAGSPPPLPARSAPAPPPPKKHALSPAQAECLRAIFAALLWHEGIVHDAIACAAFLKFHPQLPKQGARVVTRGAHEDSSLRLQRHSVEVSNAGKYLHINPTTLEALTRSGTEASANRTRKTDVDATIREEDGSTSAQDSHKATSSVVNVLPPALRALVALWDTMSDADQLTAATDKLKKQGSEKNENEEVRSLSGIRRKRDKPFKTPYSVECELCGNNVPPPLAAHMRHQHLGCKAVTDYGYDRAGFFKRADEPPRVDAPIAQCGTLAQSGQIWYIFCDKCHDKALKVMSSVKQTKTKTLSAPNPAPEPIPDIDHHAIRDNAVFLLDLAPLNYSESVSTSPWNEGPGRSPPTPPGSVWQPAPPFQCMPALGAAPRTQPDQTARYHSLGRPPTLMGPVTTSFNKSDTPSGATWRIHRSVSMGQEKGRELNACQQPQARATLPDTQDTLTGAGSSLLAQPSAALHRLVGRSDKPDGQHVSAFEPLKVDIKTLMKSPVMVFVLSRRDLHSYRHKMDAAVRMNTVRQYAFEALNWLLRACTQPTSVHDVMWWFCTALDRYARIVPPPLPLPDCKENMPDIHRSRVPTASAAAICPGGRIARGARAAFHSFLGSVSALAPSLPPASASSLQAVRCWALHYSSYDRAFLHRSQVFSVISKILTHCENGMIYDEAMLGALHESFHSVHNRETYAWECSDVTGWCDVTVSSRQGMAGALTDASTETFWESGDEDRNKAKWIEVSYAGANHEDTPHVVCVHIDNTRDTTNKTLLVTFLFAGGSSEMCHLADLEVDSKVATWLCYTLPKVSNPSVRVRCELRGPESTVRVRQLRILSAPAPRPSSSFSPAQVLQGLSETDTLRVFRLLTSQVFGKLLEWDNANSESGNEGVSNIVDETVPADDTDLREHVVGILFAGHKLTSLQKQVMTHIVLAIGYEASRVRDDWETALICAEASGHTASVTSLNRMPVALHIQDNYCFEMLSLLLALSGSAVGRAHLAQQIEMLPDLLALLHTGSERVQRQVISLLRRIITEIPPQRMFAALNHRKDPLSRITLIDHLVAYLGKAITVQVKIKGLSNSAQPAQATMASKITPSAMWYMRGETDKKHAQLVAKLLSDMAEDKISRAWGTETREALANYVSALALMTEEERTPELCVTLPTMWMALGALCVCEQRYVTKRSHSSEPTEDDGEISQLEEARPFCVNHDDGATSAVLDCNRCGTLCAECDKFLHLSRSTRNHQRQVCKEEENTVRIDVHEGCGRAKLFWLLLLVDRRTLKGLSEFRALEPLGNEITIDEATGRATGAFAGTCRFCGTRATTGLLAIGNVCADQQCQEHGRQACNRVLKCGHVCGGIRCEPVCLPCLFGCRNRSPDTLPLRQDADDMCMICFTDPLQAAPSIQLKCGHVFHLHCCKKVLASKWIGPRITFSFAQCPICKEDMDHWTLEDLLYPIKRLYEEVQRKAVMRLEYEGMESTQKKNNVDPTTYAMEKYAYYVCHKCEKAYFGGLARCEAETNGFYDPGELVCGACSDITGARSCPKHGADFLEYKCRYCCSVAVFFCFGTSHFCNSCHDDFQRVTNMPRQQLPQCPAGPKGEQLPGTPDECPLQTHHPPTGEEFALGCGVCRHTQGF